MKELKKGLKFYTYSSLKNFMKAWMEKEQELFTKERTVKIGDKPDLQKVKECLVYKSIDYACKRGGVAYRPCSEGKRQGSTYKVGCPARLRVELAGDGEKKYLVIVGTSLEHANHEPTKGSFPFFPEVRRLSTDESKEKAVEFLEAKANKKFIQQKLKSEFGKEVLLKDLQNLQYKFKSKDQHDLSTAIEFLKDRGATRSILKDKDQFKGLYFSTPDMRRSMAAWPEICCIDGTYTLLDTDLTLLLVLVEDSQGSSEIVSVGLLAAEDMPTFKWFLSTFKKDHKEACKRINCFMSDKDLLGRRILKKLFPGIPIYICLFHTLQAFKRALSKENMNLSKMMRDEVFEFLEKLTYSSCEEHYLQLYDEFSETFPLVVVQYFNKNWHDIREEWTTFNMVKGNLLNRTNNRLESINQKIKQVITKRSSLLQFLKHFFLFLESQHLEINYKASKNFNKTRCYNYEKDSCEQKYMDYLTEKAFSYILNELKYHPKVEIAVTNGETGIITHENRQIRVTKDSCECGIPTSLLLPCRHIFAFRTQLQLPLFDQKLCNERWTKSYFREKQRLFNSFTDDDSMDDRIPLICQLQRCDPKSVEERKGNLKPLMKVLVDLTSLSCGANLEAKIFVWKRLYFYWSHDWDVGIETAETSPTDLQPKIENITIEKLIEKLSKISLAHDDITQKPATVPQKRKIVNQLSQAITKLIVESGDGFNMKLNLLRNLGELWSQDSLVNIVKLEQLELLDEAAARPEFAGHKCALNQPSDDRLETDGTSDVDLKQIKYPLPTKIRGKPSQALKTTPGGRRKKKGPRKFIEETSEGKVKKMLSWLFPQERADIYLATKKQVDVDEIEFDLIHLHDAFLESNVNIQLLKPYFTAPAFSVLQNAVKMKKKNDKGSCALCDAVEDEKVHRWVLCDSCYLWYHFECVKITRKPRNDWFCAVCKEKANVKK